MHLRQLEGVSFVNRWYTKRVPFLSKMVYERIRWGWEGWRTLFVQHFAECSPSSLGYHYGPQREALCSFAACYCHIFVFCFLLFIVFRWNVPFSLHQSPLSTLSVIFHVKHHVAAVDQSKHSCTTSSFPVRW